VKVGILALQGDVREHAAAVADLGSEPVEITAPQHVGGVDALILPGGESTTLSMLLDSSELRRPLAGLIAEGMPVLGTCAGMILLAREVIGGRPDQRGFDALDIAVRRNGFGRQLQSFECDLVVAGVSGPPV
jgi:5'-phosphate synthase pdxT subunit